MMRCPSCHLDMTKKTIAGGGVFWACPSCEGRAATLPLLRRLITADFLRALWQAANSRKHAGWRHCPCCQAPMREICGDTANGQVFLDLCPSCQLLWFDRGELAALPRVTPSAGAPELPQEARERLAIIEVAAMAAGERRPGGVDLGVSAAPDQWWQWLPAMLGLPVEVEQEAVTQYPYFTWGIAALILGLSLFAFSDLEHAVQSFGLIPARLGRHGGLTLLSSFFLHASVAHLLSNLYFFMIFADNIEEFLGGRRFLLLLLLATLSGGLLHCLSDARSTLPCVGASGGISGLLAFYALQFPRSSLVLRIFKTSVHGSWLRLPVWLWFVAWALLQSMGAWMQLQGVSAVSAIAHLGGAAAGGIFWLYYRREGRP
jgi:membrane associated rhomboid family serine protease/Zn-finger nucleic acid-binding protein